MSDRNMKRVNIHLDSESMSKMDKVLEIVNKNKKNYWRSNTTRADLVRFAIGEMFQIQYPRTRWGFDKEAVKSAISKVSKEKAND